MTIYKRIKIMLWSLFFFFLFWPFFMQELGLAQVPMTAPPAKPPEQVGQPDPFKEKISLDYKDVDISSIIRSLSYTYGLNLVTSGEVKGKITVSLKDVTLAEALDVILTANGYNYTHKGNIIYITPGAVEGAQLVSEPITLEYLKAGDAQNLLRKVLSPKGDIKVDEMFNILVVTDYPANIEKLKQLLKSVDQAPQQVLIEAKIVDITSKDLQNLGITWQIDYNPGHGLWDRQVANTSERLKGTGTFGGPSSSLSGNQIKIDTFVLKGLTATATLDALIQDQKANLLASPSIAVINNREARIIIGEKVPYKERTQTTTGTTETTKFIDVGTALRVTPSINEDGYITMSIHPEVSSVSALLDAGPRITTREADTMVRVKEGETVVIGGLIKQEDNRTASRLPILGYIPVLGYLFGNRSKDQTQQELTVFITPKILRSREEMLAHGKKRYEEEAVVNITTTGSLNAQKELMDKANNLDAAVGLEARRKEDWMLKNQAVSIYESVLSQFPDGPMAPEAGFRAARIYFNDLNESYRARELCAVIISNYPNSEYAFHAREMYKKIVTDLEKERLEKLKKSGRKDYYQEKDKEKAIGSAIGKALDIEKTEEVRQTREESKRKVEEERQRILAEREAERKAKEETRQKALEEKRKQQEEQEDARRKAIEEKKKQDEEARQAREEEKRLAYEKAEVERVAKEETRRKAIEEKKNQEEQIRLAREEEKRLAYEKAEAERKAREEAGKIARENAEAERKAKEEARLKAKENIDEIKKVEAQVKAQEREKERVATEEAKRKAEEERQRLLAKNEAERAAKEEARQRALEEKRKQQQEQQEARQRVLEEKKKQDEEARQVREEEQRKLRVEKEKQSEMELAARRKAEEEARKARQEVKRKAEEERQRLLAKNEAERAAKEEARQRALEEKRKQQKEQEDAWRKAVEEKKKQDEEARKAREEEQRKLRVEKEKQREMELAAQRKAEKEARQAREEAKRKAEEERQRLLAKNEAERAAKEETRQRVLEEKRKQQKEQQEAHQRALEEKKKQDEEARQAREEEQRKLRVEKEKQREMELAARRKAEEEASKARQGARRKAEEERQRLLAKKEEERKAAEEARRKATEEIKRVKEEERKQAEELKLAKQEAEKEAAEKTRQAKLEAIEKVKQKAQEIQIKALQRRIEKE